MDREIAAIMREDEAVRAFAWDNGTWVRTEQLQAPSGRTDMRLVLCGALLALISSVADAADAPVAICSPDPNHLWNRLYHAMAICTLDGVQYGADIAEPYPDDFDGRKRLISTLDEFVRTQGERSLPGETRRALMLNDVWTAFDISAVHGGIELRSRIARAIERLRMPTSDVARLKDNYAEAVKSGKFPKDFDPAHPDIAFLPPDLFDPAGPWVQIKSERGLVAPIHVQMVSGRSAFLVFIRCPGGREATLSYLQRLNVHPTPWQPNPASLGTSYPEGRQVRMDVLRPDQNTPQFPEGTVVALVRRMMVIDEKLDPVVTPITQKVQFRVYRKLQAMTHELDWPQSAYEFVMRRRELIAGMGGGLHPVSPDEREYQALLVPHEKGNASYFTGPVVLRTCAGCHRAKGIFSVGSYLGMFDHNPTNPQLLPASQPEDQGVATARWKKAQFNWGLLEGLLQAERSR